MRTIELIVVTLQFFASVQTSHVQEAKTRIRAEIRHALGPDIDNRPPAAALPSTHTGNHISGSSVARNGPRKSSHILHQKPRRFSHRRRLGAHYTSWTGWSRCDSHCRQLRERFCKKPRICGDIKHMEERKCKYCHPEYHHQHQHHEPLQSVAASPILETYQPSVLKGHHQRVRRPYHSYHLPVYQEIHSPDDDHDYFVVKKRYKKKRKPVLIEVEDYQDLEDEDESEELGSPYKKNDVKSIRTQNWYNNKQNYQSLSSKSQTPREKTPRNLNSPDIPAGYGYTDDYDGDILDNQRQTAFYGNQDYDMDEVLDELEIDIDRMDRIFTEQNSSLTPVMEKAVFDASKKRKRIYSRWSKWSKCSTKCTTRRYKKCKVKKICGKEVLREIAYCYTEGSFCHQWLEGQVKKSDDFNPRPMAQNRKDILSPNAIANDYILSGKGYRGPEYAAPELKCGIPMIKNSRKNMYSMLKIIGGRTARKGQWPWQVVIFNRFKEAFCGGTLISPDWVLTAAHCVRKVLYVRLGEHNLDIQEGTEVEYRIAKSIKHPNYDKKTVDSDVALLRLPHQANITTWIGYSCMPRPYQPLPKNIQCTVIGWGKRRNHDASGTSLLHQAQVPIISMDNCKEVYYDYTITKNMFCAGHKKGRIDTCAGDSGGPILCRDTTKPNHPWTIFGITSFGDGCAKKNKFGIYAKVSNYVDWVWSVVNCNGNCKAKHTSSRLL